MIKDALHRWAFDNFQNFPGKYAAFLLVLTLQMLLLFVRFPVWRPPASALRSAAVGKEGRPVRFVPAMQPSFASVAAHIQKVLSVSAPLP